VNPDTGAVYEPKYGWGAYAVDRNDDGIYIRNTVNDKVTEDGVTGGVRAYAAPVPGYAFAEEYAYEEAAPGDEKYYQPVNIELPTKSPMEALDMTIEELIRSAGGLSCDQI
jgi:hypothetical protein